MEQQYLYVECAEEDRRRGQHKVAECEAGEVGSCTAGDGEAMAGLEIAAADRGCAATESCNSEPIPA